MYGTKVDAALFDVVAQQHTGPATASAGAFPLVFGKGNVVVGRGQLGADVIL